MIKIPQYKDKRVAVFGLGLSGRSVVAALGRSGAYIVAWDDSDASRDALINDARLAVAADRVELSSVEEWNWKTIDALVLSPGVPLHHPEPHPAAAAARAAGVDVIGDIELFAQAMVASRAKPTIVAVTGTNGKSTTTALIGHVLRATSAAVHVGGNIGMPALDLPEPGGGSIYVLEISSYQLDLTTSFRADIALLLNVSEDHLDRHGGLEGYVDAKKRIFANQTRGDTAIVCVDDDPCQNICTEILAANGRKVIPVSSEAALSRGFYVADGRLFGMIDGRVRQLGDLRNAAALVGVHNWRNAAAAFAACQCIQSDIDALAGALLSFPGLAHRQERVAMHDGVCFVNDSKATNPHAAATALAAYERIYWIAGGRAKDGGFDAITPYLGHIKKAYLIGEAADTIDAFLDGRVDIEHAGDLPKALAAATRDAMAESDVGDTHDVGEAHSVILLAPACASFDQYRNFEARGDHFRDLVAEQSTAGGQAA